VLVIVGVVTGVWIGVAMALRARDSIRTAEDAYGRLDKALADSERSRESGRFSAITSSRPSSPRESREARGARSFFPPPPNKKQPELKPPINRTMSATER